MADLLWAIPVMIVLLLLKGFFSGSEIALVNSDRIKLRARAKQGDQGARLAIDLLKKPDVLLSTTLVGTNMATVILTTIGTMLMIQFFGSLGDLWAFLLFTPIMLIFGEIVPKSVYQQKSDTITPVIIHPLRWSSWLFAPIIFIFSRIARFAARLVGGGKREQTMFITREQLQSLVEMAEHGTALSALDRGQVRRVIRFAETTVAEAMIPTAEVTALSRTGTTADAIQLVRRHGYNRLPVYERSSNNIIGIVTLSTWDLMDAETQTRTLDDLIKPALYVSPNQTIDELLPVLNKRTDHMAIVVDEFGSAVGMITMEDIVEEVVGEIDVGYDFEEYLPRRKRTVEEVETGIFLMDSRLSISEASEVLDIPLPAKEFHTLGGMVIGRLRHIPKTGESITENGFRFVVEEATERSIVKLRVEAE
ncbi:hemolysin family protein [Magnetospira sp. QH-2]|uniref:hemolysin family protein n=1 Tax=Magnetospira sp. (strain QH-2) TaxID=1288970 RepID=UPI0003E8172A|nr:hemolysin family protein [Magnetospira sp. QH-2]CCQ74398.1 Conserved membrane protein of unknown function [Magnetospira sp. QH-2]